MSEDIVALRRLTSASREAPDDAWRSFLIEYDDLIRFAIRRTERDPDAAGDAYVAVLEGLRQDEFRRLRAFDPDGPAKFTTWLVVVVRRLVIDLRRTRSNSVLLATDEAVRTTRLDALASALDERDTLPDETARDPSRDLEVLELRTALASAIEQLQPRDCLLLSLRFEDGMTARRIAEVMGFPSQFHVYRRLKRVLETLRASLESVGIAGPGG